MSAAAPWPGAGQLAGQKDLLEQLLVLKRRWPIIATITLATLALAGLFVTHTTRSYTATGIVLYDPANAPAPGADPAQQADLPNEDALTASQAAIIDSLPIARSLAASLNLAQYPAFNATLRHAVWPFRAGRKPRFNPDDVALAAQHALAVEVEPGSRVLAVSFTAANADLAAQAANMAMRIYLDHERGQSLAAMTQDQSWLQDNAAGLQSQLEATETRLARARAAAGIVAGMQGSLTTETASRIAASLVQAQADLAMNQARLGATSQSDAADAQIAPNLLPLRKEQADLLARVRALQGEYGPDYPDLVAARTSLAAISGEINAETGREVAAARADVAADQAEIATLQNALTRQRDESQAEDNESAPIQALEQRAEAEKSMLRGVTLQADQIAQDVSLTRPDARILSAAEPPLAAAGPGHGLILGCAAGFGLCLGLMLAGLSEALDTSFRSGGDLRAGAGLACLAMIPNEKSPQIAVLSAPFSVFTEQLRALQTGLALGRPDQPCRVLAITAARPGEGKTTLTTALGRALAAAGLRVIAIDGDIRQPGFDQIFGLNGAPGLTDHLSGQADLAGIIHQDPASALAVIGAGTQARNALALYLSPSLKACLEILRTRYDVVLLDVPPAFALAEGRVLAALADSALLCVRWGDTPRRVVLAAITLLRESGVTLAGAVLTRVNGAAHKSSGFPDAEIYQPRYGGYFRSG